MNNIEVYLTQLIEQAVSKAVNDAFASIVSMTSYGSLPDYLTKEKLMELTGWSGRTIQHLRDTRQIDFVQHGRKILYPTAELYDFFESHRVKRRSKI